MTRQPREPVMLVGAQEAPEPVTLRGIGSPLGSPDDEAPGASDALRYSREPLPPSYDCCGVRDGLSIDPVPRCAARASRLRQAMIAAVKVMVSPSILSLALASALALVFAFALALALVLAFLFSPKLCQNLAM